PDEPPETVQQLPAAMIASKTDASCAPLMIALLTLILRIISVSARGMMLSRFRIADSTPNHAVRRSWRAVRISLTRISQLLPSTLGGWPSVVRLMQASKLLAGRVPPLGGLVSLGNTRRPGRCR